MTRRQLDTLVADVHDLATAIIGLVHAIIGTGDADLDRTGNQDDP